MVNPIVHGPASTTTITAPVSSELAKAIPTSMLPERRHAGVMFPTLGPDILQPPYNTSFVAGARLWSPEVSDSIATFLERMFRQGLEYEPKFARRCDPCDKNYDRDVEECEICGKPTREPDPKQERLADAWLQKVNANGMKLSQFCRLHTDYGLTFDDAFILRLYDYKLNGDGEEVKDPELKEFWTASSERMRLIYDSQYRRKGYVADAKGNKHGFFTCKLHRERLYNTGEERCERRDCRLPVHPCVAVGLDINGQPTHGYLENEVLQWSPRNPGPGYGFSRIATLETVIKTIAAMDAQEWLIYAHDRPPKGFMVFNTDNPETLQAQFRKLDAERGSDPNFIPKFALQSTSKSGGAQFVSLTPTYNELENLDHRKDHYRRIWSSFEVEPIFMADTSVGGGLNNEGRQLTVNLQAVESIEEDWHEILFPFMEEAIGLTDYQYKFPDPAEKDKAADCVLRGQNLQHRMIIEQAGGATERTDEDTWEFQIVDEPDFEIMGGSMGGMMGGSMGRQYGSSGGWGNQYGDQGQDSQNIEMEKSIELYQKAVAEERTFYGQLMDRLNEMLKGLTKRLDEYQTTEQQQALIDGVVGYSVGEMAAGAEQDMARALVAGIQDARADPAGMGINMDAVRTMTSGSPVWQSFADMSTEMSQEIGSIIQQAFLKPQEVDMTKLTRKLADRVGGSRHQLRRIARTESNRVTNLGRELGYQHRDPEGEFRYKWVGGIDARTCKAHTELIRRTAAQPVPLEVLKEMVQKLGREQMGPNWTIQDWVIHPNQRGAIVRVVV
jgi:hypothetical protein